MTRTGSRRRRSGTPAAAAEIELKLRLPPARLRQALALPLLAAARGARTQKLSATYFDTPAMDLWRNRIVLRVRREGGRWVQAVKGGGSVASGVHTRLEMETVIPDARPDVSVLPREPVTKILRSQKIADTLVPVLSTEISRSVRLLEPAPGVLIEVAIDRGVIRSGRRREAVCELELELKRGPVTALFDLARRLAAAIPLALEHRSKAERGYALFSASVAAPVKATPILLARSMNAGEAFRAIAASALAQVHANAYGVIGSKDPEYLHQMRVGLRRLRSALSLFRDLLGDDFAPHAAALRTIAVKLGAARDWDVLVIETMPEIRAVSPPVSAATAFAAVCVACQQASRRESQKYIKTNNYLDAMLALGRWLVSPSLTAAAGWQEAARSRAARILVARHARVLKRGSHLARCSAADLHRLRIAVKKMRYAVEFFAGLFQVKEMAVQRARLAKLQDILGHINDAAVVEPLLDAASSAAAPGREVKAAAAIVLEWHRVRAVAEREKLHLAWRRYRAARRPWRE